MCLVNVLSHKKIVQILGILLKLINYLTKIDSNTLFFYSLTKAPCSKFVQEMFDLGRDEYVRKADSWKAVPDSVYNENTKQPAIIYGVYHLLRLLGNNFSVI